MMVYIEGNNTVNMPFRAALYREMPTVKISINPVCYVNYNARLALAFKKDVSDYSVLCLYESNQMFCNFYLLKELDYDEDLPPLRKAIYENAYMSNMTCFELYKLEVTDLSRLFYKAHVSIIGKNGVVWYYINFLCKAVSESDKNIYVVHFAEFTKRQLELNDEGLHPNEQEGVDYFRAKNFLSITFSETARANCINAYAKEHKLDWEEVDIKGDDDEDTLLNQSLNQ